MPPSSYVMLAFGSTILMLSFPKSGDDFSVISLIGFFWAGLGSLQAIKRSLFAQCESGSKNHGGDRTATNTNCELSPENWIGKLSTRLAF